MVGCGWSWAAVALTGGDERSLLDSVESAWRLAFLEGDGWGSELPSAVHNVTNWRVRHILVPDGEEWEPGRSYPEEWGDDWQQRSAVCAPYVDLEQWPDFGADDAG